MDNIFSLNILFSSLSLLLIVFIISNWALAQTKHIKLKHLEACSLTSPIHKYIVYIIKYREKHIYSTYIYITITSLLLGATLYKIIQYLETNTTCLSFVDNSLIFYFFFLVAILFLTIITLLIDFFKGLFEFNAEKTLALLSPIIYFFGKIISFLPTLIITTNNTIFKILGQNVKRQVGTFFSSKEIGELLEESSEHGVIQNKEKELMKSVINFSGTLAKDIMTPRHEIVYVDLDANVLNVADTFAKEAYSRLVVCDKDLDNVKGIVLAKDILSYMTHNNDQNILEKKAISDLIRPAYFVQENKDVNDLLQELRKQGIHLAIVLDEHGGVEGLITIEDLLEEIVGDIMDEHDILENNEKDEIITANDGAIIVSGLLSIRDFNDKYNDIIPEGEYETIGGFMIKTLSRMPKKGDGFEFNNYKFQVESLLEHRINKIKIYALKKEDSKEK